jgi:murein DD-endopeptidase MepM/ murein hydrolase activator NlpD
MFGSPGGRALPDFYRPWKTRSLLAIFERMRRYKFMSSALRILLAAVLFPLFVHAGALSIEQAGGKLQLAWKGEEGLAYDLETSTNLIHWVSDKASYPGRNTPVQVAISNDASCAFFRLMTRYQNDEEGAVADMLTPVYYNATNDAAFREALNEFIFFAQKEPFHHPLQDGTNSLPTIHVPAGGVFGADKTGLMGFVVESHPATDFYVGNQWTAVDLFAAYDGTVTTARDLNKYNHAVYLTKNITNGFGDVLGKLVTLYAHVDLDLDEAGGLFMNGQSVQAGDLISEHLYSDTRGGPHLHFEIRYYRPSETGNEEFYGFSYSEPSAGPWVYGTWDPNKGYGFGDPRNHRLLLE